MRASDIGDSMPAIRLMRITRSNGPVRSAHFSVTSRTMRSLVALVVSVANVIAFPLMAAPATYSGESPVANQTEAARSGALKTALADVVIRLSGDAGILARDDVAKAVAAADKYVLQYRYRNETVTDDSTGGAGQQLVLVAEFDSNAVDRMLAGLGLAGAGSAVAIDTTPVQKRVWLSGIHSAADYARSFGYLSKQAMVRQSWPIEARGDGVLIRVELAGDFNRWLGQVNQDGIFQVNSASPPVQDIDATLSLNP